MDEYEEPVRALMTERFTRWRPPSPSGVHVDSTEQPFPDVGSTRTSVTARISVGIPQSRGEHHGEE